MDLKEINSGINQHTHWYYQSKKLPLFNYFDSLPDTIQYHIIDVGSGTGFFAASLLAAFPNKIKACYLIDIEYTDEEIEASKQSKLIKQREIPDTIENTLVVMMDVLEHLEHDNLMLQQIKKNCVGNHNYFFITVPAFTSLWSQHDIYLCHFRRYTIQTLQQVLISCKYQIQSTYYLYGTLFPLVWIQRKIANLRPPKSDYSSEMKNVAPWLNRTLSAIAKFDAEILTFNKLAGVTCVAYGKIPR